MTRPLKIVLVHRYFAPDTPPYAHMLASIAGALASRGHHVTVLTCQPSYNRAVVKRAPRRETIDGVDIVRYPVVDGRRSLLRKTANLVWFSVRLLLARRIIYRADAVMAGSTPPLVIAALCSRLSRFHNTAFIYHKQDIWPEVSGRQGAVFRLLRNMDHQTEISARRVVVLSQDMAETVQARGEARVEIEVLNNFDPWGAETKPQARLAGSGLTVVFAGNLGHFQGLEYVIAIMEATASDDAVDWHFFGEGPLRTVIERAHGRVTVHGHRPPEEVAEFIGRRADLGVVSLNPGVVHAAYPSKTLTYLRNGCPLLALVEADSSLARMVVQERIGITASQHSSVQSVASLLSALARDPSPLIDADSRARAVYESRFAKQIQLARWCDLIEDVAS